MQRSILPLVLGWELHSVSSGFPKALQNTDMGEMYCFVQLQCRQLNTLNQMQQTPLANSFKKKPMVCGKVKPSFKSAAWDNIIAFFFFFYCKFS